MARCAEIHYGLRVLAFRIRRWSAASVPLCAWMTDFTQHSRLEGLRARQSSGAMATKATLDHTGGLEYPQSILGGAGNTWYVADGQIESPNVDVIADAVLEILPPAPHNGGFGLPARAENPLDQALCRLAASLSTYFQGVIAKLIRQ